MTPREADVAFVLEGVPGVGEVCALDGVSTFGFAVRLDGAHALARAHYQLLRVLTHEECARVYLYETELPAALRARARRLVLSERERMEARARVSATSAALEQEPVSRAPVLLPAPVGFRVLLVADDVEAWRVVVAALGMGTERILEPDVESALALSRGRAFDMIVCQASRAFGRRGFVTALATEDPGALADVVLVTSEGQRELTISSLKTLCVWCPVLTPWELLDALARRRRRRRPTVSPSIASRGRRAPETRRASSSSRGAPRLRRVRAASSCAP